MPSIRLKTRGLLSKGSSHRQNTLNRMLLKVAFSGEASLLVVWQAFSPSQHITRPLFALAAWHWLDTKQIKASQTNKQRPQEQTRMVDRHWQLCFFSHLARVLTLSPLPKEPKIIILVYVEVNGEGGRTENHKLKLDHCRSWFQVKSLCIQDGKMLWSYEWSWCSNDNGYDRKTSKSKFRFCFLPYFL